MRCDLVVEGFLGRDASRRSYMPRPRESCGQGSGLGANTSAGSSVWLLDCAQRRPAYDTTARDRVALTRTSYIRLALFAAIAGCVVLALPARALAHGLNVDDDPNRPLVQYVVLGFEHMALGWDHLLFIVGCVLLAPSVKTAAKLVSLFVLGHSLTLLVATLAGWKMNVTAVDVAIALSVVFVGVLGVWRGEKNWRVVGAVVFGFGLVHGLGLSTRLQAIALP